MARGKTCKDCVFLQEETGFLRTRTVCLEPSKRGRRIRESDPACADFTEQVVKPGLSLIQELGHGVRRSVATIRKADAEAEKLDAVTKAPKGADGQPDAAPPTSDDLAALEARAAAAEARAQALEAKAALAEARARASSASGGTSGGDCAKQDERG